MRISHGLYGTARAALDAWIAAAQVTAATLPPVARPPLPLKKLPSPLAALC